MNGNILAPEFSRNWKWMIVRGIVSVMFGIAAALYPLTAVTALALFFGAYVFADGVFAIVSIFTTKYARAHFWSYLAEGIAGIAAGILTFILPEITLYGLVILVSAWAFITGIFEIITAIKLRKIIDGEFFMIVSGILSLFFAVLVFMMPLDGLVLMIYLIGVYAIIFGAMLILLGFSMKSLDQTSGRISEKEEFSPVARIRNSKQQENSKKHKAAEVITKFRNRLT